MSTESPKKGEPVNLRVTIMAEIQFPSYGKPESDEKAKEQIKIWLEETLSDEDTIPLFVVAYDGERTTSKNVSIFSMETLTKEEVEKTS